ncbi:MAG: GLPGLI family protein [Flavobacteriia bacterium]|nr:GLPGLI family protein [Flavobacteriia bacterium]
MRTFLYTIGVLFMASGALAAQEFQGTATYMTKTTMDMDFGGRQMPEAQKKMIQQRMKSMLEKTFVLNFNRTSSTYVEEQKLAQPGAAGGGGMRFMGLGGGGSGVYYKDIQSKTYTNETDIFGKPFLVVDELKPLEWTLTAETKQIGQYTCYKATAVRQADTTMVNLFRNMRPRPRGGEASEGAQKSDSTAVVSEDSSQKDSVASGQTGGRSLTSRFEPPTETAITAWYTLDIPISQGPKEYWGLPGLILEVSEGRTAILCSKIVINPKEPLEIEAPSKGKKISQAEFQETMAKKVKEMSENFRGGGRSGGARIMIRN